MTNDETRMTNQIPNPNVQKATALIGLEFETWNFIRHSSFVIRHSNLTVSPRFVSLLFPFYTLHG